MRFNNEKIYIRPFSASEVDKLSEWYYGGDYPFFFRNFCQTLERDAFHQAGHLMGGVVQSVFSRETNELVGMVGLVDWRPVPRTVKLMALIEKDHQAKGYMFEAFEILHDHAFNKLDCRMTMIDVAAEDERSMSLCERAGYENVGPVDLCVVNGLVQADIRWKMTKETYLQLYGGN